MLQAPVGSTTPVVHNAADDGPIPVLPVIWVPVTAAKVEVPLTASELNSPCAPLRPVIEEQSN